MAIGIKAVFEVNTVGGPSIKASQILSVEAYDLVDVTIADAASDFSVQLQPSPAAGDVQLLVMSASAYDAGLSYKVNDAGNPSYEFDHAMILTGPGAVGLLGFPPERLLFSNIAGKDISIQILIGRNATP